MGGSTSVRQGPDKPADVIKSIAPDRLGEQTEWVITLLNKKVFLPKIVICHRNRYNWFNVAIQAYQAYLQMIVHPVDTSGYPICLGGQPILDRE